MKGHRHVSDEFLEISLGHRLAQLAECAPQSTRAESRVRLSIPAFLLLFSYLCQIKPQKKIFKERSLGQTSEIVSFYFQLFDFQKWGERIQQFSEKVVFLHSWTDTFTAVKWPECFFQREVIDRVWRRLSRPAQLGCITSSLWTLRLLAAELCSLYLLQIDPVDKLFFQKISRVNEAVVFNA